MAIGKLINRNNQLVYVPINFPIYLPTAYCLLPTKTHCHNYTR